MAGDRKRDRAARRAMRMVLRLLPRAIRERRAEELEWTFERRLADASSRRLVPWLMFVLRELWGVVRAGFAWRSSVRTAGGSGRSRAVALADAVARDVRVTVRVLRRAPGFAIIAIFVLSLGIGASVAIFSAVDAVLLAPLPLHEPDRLVAMWESNRDRGWVRGQVAPANYLDWKERLDGFEDIAAYNDWQQPYELGGAGDPRRVLGNEATGNLFDVLGVQPLLGRGFDDAATWEDSPDVVVLSEGLWRDAFGADPDVIGRTIQLDRSDVTVVGVMPSSLRFPREGTQLWRGTRWSRAQRTQDFFRRAHMVRVVGRLERGEPIDRAAERIAELGRMLQREYPVLNLGMEHGLSPLHEYLSASSRVPLLILFGAVGLLLLTACANVGNLVLVRGLARERELAVRGALGASRMRVVLQLVTENGILAMIGGGLGLLLGAWGTRLIATHRPVGLEAWHPIEVDARVVVFALGVTAASALLFGVLPALRSVRPGLTPVLRDASRTTAGVSPTRISNALVVAEIALSLLLITGAGLLARSLARLRDVPAGVDTRNVLTMSMNLPAAAYESNERIVAFWNGLVERIREVPGVVSAGGITRVTLSGTTWSGDFTADGWSPDRFGTDVAHREILPGYIETMRVPLLRGRLLDDRDVGSAKDPGVLINEALARRYFADEDPVGKRITFDRVPEPGSYWRTIVGIVGDEHQSGLDVEPRPEFLGPVAVDARRNLTLVIRTRTDPAAFTPAILEVIRSMDEALPVYAVRTMEEVRARSMAQARFLIALFTLFATIALVLAVIGVYGIMAQAARARTHEIGIRMALGARSGDVQRMMFGRGAILLSGGVVIGVLAAIGAGRFLSSLLFDIEPTDPLTFAAVIGLLAASATLATWIPARLAARTDPMVALRSD